jgi:hypothetical protein
MLALSNIWRQVLRGMWGSLVTFFRVTVSPAQTPVMPNAPNSSANMPPREGNVCIGKQRIVGVHLPGSANNPRIKESDRILGVSTAQWRQVDPEV